MSLLSINKKSLDGPSVVYLNALWLYKRKWSALPGVSKEGGFWVSREPLMRLILGHRDTPSDSLPRQALGRN